VWPDPTQPISWLTQPIDNSAVCVQLQPCSMVWLALKSTAFDGKHHKIATTPSRSFKVTDICANRKLLYDLVLVNHKNSHRIWQSFRDFANYWSNRPDTQTDGRTDVQTLRNNVCKLRSHCQYKRILCLCYTADHRADVCYCYNAYTASAWFTYLGALG